MSSGWICLQSDPHRLGDSLDNSLVTPDPLPARAGGHFTGEIMSTTSQSGNQGRLWAIAEVSNRTPRVAPSLAEMKVSELFGSNTFNQRAMADKLPKDVYRELQKTIKQGTHLNRSIAKEVAHAVKEWAIEKGAT